MKTILLALTLTSFATASLISNIPRKMTRAFVAGGTFNGGSAVRANLENIRVALHPKEDYERWVIDFSDETSRTLGSVAPRFQVRYVPAERELISDGSLRVVAPPKFVVSLRSIKASYLERDRAKLLPKKSVFVKDVRLYPKIDGGDMSFELILHEDVIFEAHQPIEKEGRLVLDLRKVVGISG